MTSAGKWMFIIGLVLSLIALAVLLWTGYRGVQVIQEVVDNSEPLGDGVTVTMAEGETRLVVAETGTPTGCTVTLPDGSEQQLDQAGADQLDGQGLTTGGLFTAQTAGEHTFACEGGDNQLSGPVDFGSLGLLAVAAVAGLALVPLGLLTLIGLILWLVGRSRDQRALRETSYRAGDPGQGYPPPPQDGPYGGGSYPGQGDTPGYDPNRPYEQGQPRREDDGR
jgi:hypothetical protein